MRSWHKKAFIIRSITHSLIIKTNMSILKGSTPRKMYFLFLILQNIQEPFCIRQSRVPQLFSLQRAIHMSACEIPPVN